MRLGRPVIAMLPALVALALVVSCARERFEEPVPVDNEDISLLVREAKPMATKAAGQYMELVFSDDSMDVYLEVTERDMTPRATVCDTARTKGTPYIGNALGEFSVTAFLEADNDTPFFKDLKLNSDGSEVGTGYYWPVTTPPTKISFFGFARNQDNGTLSGLTYDPETLGGSFSYALPDPVGDETSAVEQPDLLFAIAPKQEKTDNAVEMGFYHALSAIVFKVGRIPADFIVEKVEFTNLPSSGSCGYESDGLGVLSFEWTPSGTKKNFTQTFAKQMSDAEGKVEDEAVSAIEQTFMMIPGEIPPAAELVVTVSFDKGDDPKTTYVIRKTLKDLIATWTAGKQYVYKISSPEEIEVEVDDEVVDNGTRKQELEIRNTGLAPSYMRAILVGYWVVPGATEAEDLIVGQWQQPAINVSDSEADGVFEQAADFEANWIVGSDGFYYYKHPVPSGEVTTDLFESYTLTGTPPAVGSELVLTIAVQAVIESKITQTGWPVELDSDGVTLKKK